MVLSPTGLKGCRIKSTEDHMHLQHQYCIDILISICSMRCNIYKKKSQLPLLTTSSANAYGPQCQLP
ncbi:hypothetical protein MUK42_21044 [Musa troglodytarum]|uniref:Uncharacterized protein n=1 Tax=Musa troglodytarum TaxID=320322 RepID=A0A9E7G813_9LILI|nr:hypothetical protein MUK42_21044 [Musa troglodytarum]